MPYGTARAERRASLKSELIRRVRAGETVAGVCAGRLHAATVSRWAAGDVSFADALADAKRRGEARRRHGFDEALARAFLVRLAAGERLRDILADPAMPGRERLRVWRATQGEFGGEVWRILGVRKREGMRTVRKGAVRRYRPWTEAEGDRVLVRVGRGEPVAGLHAADPSLPEPWLIARWRRETPEFAADLALNSLAGRRARRRGHIRDASDAVLDALLAGGSFHSEAGRGGLPCRATLSRWVRADPVFAADVAWACQEREHVYLNQIVEIARAAQWIGAAEAHRRIAPISRQLGQLTKRPGVRAEP